MLPVTSANGDEPAIARLHAAPAQPLQLASGVGALPSIEVADALLDERREMSEWATTRRARSSTDTGPGLRLSALPCFAAETYALPNAFTRSAEKSGEPSPYEKRHAYCNIIVGIDRRFGTRGSGGGGSRRGSTHRSAACLSLVPR